MATRIAEMTEEQLAEYRAWLGGAVHEHFGLCHTCERTHEDEGHPLLVARQPRRTGFECLQCFTSRTSRRRQK